MKSIKDITRIVRFAIISTPDKDLWTHPLEDVDKARTEETHYMAAFLVGEERGEPVKKTFETLMAEFREFSEFREAGASWCVLCELYAALFFYAMAAHQDGDVSACVEYHNCMDDVTSVLNEEFGDDKAKWTRFVNYMRTLKEVNFVKNAKKVENRKEKETK